jgi:cytochrome c
MILYRLSCLAALSFAVGLPAVAQLPPAAEPTPQSLFVSQCSLCHTLSPRETVRQGPPLGGVFGRKVGSVAGFKYSPGFADADFVWDAFRLDAWLTRPQDVIPGATMVYRQASPSIRHRLRSVVQVGQAILPRLPPIRATRGVLRRWT